MSQLTAGLTNSSSADLAADRLAADQTVNGISSQLATDQVVTSLGRMAAGTSLFESHYSTVPADYRVVIGQPTPRSQARRFDETHLLLWNRLWAVR